jgi:hypothetical protein
MEGPIIDPNIISGNDLIIDAEAEEEVITGPTNIHNILLIDSPGLYQ